MVGRKTSKTRKAIFMTNARKTKAMTKGASQLDSNGSDANKTPTDKESNPLTTIVETNPPFANAEEANNPFANPKEINNPFACDKEKSNPFVYDEERNNPFSIRGEEQLFHTQGLYG
jgi:hypothetical protein